MPGRPVNSELPMSRAAPNPQADADRLEETTDQAIAACGGARRAQGDDRRERVSGIGSLRIDAGRFTRLHARKVQDLYRVSERECNFASIETG